MYPKMTWFIFSFSKFLFKKTICQRIVSANDIVLLADEATSTVQKEMMGVFIGYFNEVLKSFLVDFISLVSVSSTKSQILIKKIKEIMINCGIDITKTRFVCFEGANSMSGEKGSVQRHYQNDAPFSIYINCNATGYYIIGFKVFC